MTFELRAPANKMVRPAGLEPARPKALRFERSVYSDSNQGRKD